MPTKQGLLECMHQIGNILFPRRCLMCDHTLLYEERVLCTSCLVQAPIMSQKSFTDNEMCRLFWHLLPIERATAMLRYNAYSQWTKTVTEGKYNGRYDMLTGLGRLMAQHFMPQGFFNGIEAIVPMPISRKRLRQRGYNQATMIAKGVSKETGIPIVEDAVKRTDNGPSQTQRTARERHIALKGAFILCNMEHVRGRHVLLVDDVCTTGSSLIALGETLRCVPGIRISILVLARTSI